MSTLPVTKWFDELKRIWLEKDITFLKEIMADEFNYFEDPFLHPIQTRADLEAAWLEINEQTILKLEINVLIDGQTEGSGMYHCIYSDQAGVRHESKGSCYLKLDTEGKATEFRQWWTTQD